MNSLSDDPMSRPERVASLAEAEVGGILDSSDLDAEKRERRIALTFFAHFTNANATVTAPYPSLGSNLLARGAGIPPTQPARVAFDARTLVKAYERWLSKGAATR